MAIITLIDKAISVYDRELTEATFSALFPNDFNYNSTGKCFINSIRVVLPIELTSLEAQNYTFKVILFQGVKNDSGWQNNVSSDGNIQSYWKGSSIYSFTDSQYKSICNNILGETTLTFSASAAESKNRWWAVTISNIQIDANNFYNNKRIDIGLIQTSGDSVSYNAKDKPSSEVNSAYSWASNSIVSPMGNFSNIQTQVLDSTNSELSSSYSPIAGKHKLKVSWSYSDSSISGYYVVLSRDENFVSESYTSSTSIIFNTTESGYYFIRIRPYVLVGSNYLWGDWSDSISPVIFYKLNFNYGGNSKFSFTDSSGSLINSSTTSSTINISWPLDTFTVKRNDEENSGYEPTYLTFSYQINGTTNSLKANYTTGSASISNISSGSTFTLVSVIASVSEPRSSAITLSSSDSYDINKIISTTTAALVTGLNLINIKYVTHSSSGDKKVIGATANVNFSNFPSGTKTFQFTFGSKTISYNTTETGGTATIELGANLQGVSFSSYSVQIFSNGSALTFKYNNQTVNSVTYNHGSTLYFLSNWGISPSVNLDGNINFTNSTYMLSYLQLVLNNYYLPTDTSLLNITADAIQGNKTLSWLNTSLTSTLNSSLNREALESFVYDTEIKVTIKITSSNFPIDSLSSSTSNEYDYYFKIAPSCSYDGLSIKEGNIIQKYDLEKWISFGSEEDFQSSTLVPSFTIPDALNGGQTDYSISLDESGILDINNNLLTVSTNSNTPTRPITISLNIRYTKDSQLLYNGTRSVILTVKDERAPYIPNLELTFSNLYNNTYFLPNYSTLKIQQLQNIKYPSETNKRISFSLQSYINENGTQRSSIQEIILTDLNNLEEIDFDINKIYSSLFIENNENSYLGLKIIASSGGRSSSKDIISEIIPAYIEQPKLNNVVAESTEMASQAKVTYSIAAGALKDVLTYKVVASLINSIKPEEKEDKIEEITYGTTEKNILFSGKLPDNGNVSAYIRILYNDTELFISQTKTMGFAKEVGEIAIRKHKVGFHGEPPDNHSLAIYAVSVDENAYILSFHNEGTLLGGVQIKNGVDVIFSAGEWV